MNNDEGSKIIVGGLAVLFVVRNGDGTGKQFGGARFAPAGQRDVRAGRV
jgi:hypothetical protein